MILGCVSLQDDATLKCWGQNDQGQLGQGDILNRGDEANGPCPPTSTAFLVVPAQVSSLFFLLSACRDGGEPPFGQPGGWDDGRSRQRRGQTFLPPQRKPCLHVGILTSSAFSEAHPSSSDILNLTDGPFHSLNMAWVWQNV